MVGDNPTVAYSDDTVSMPLWYWLRIVEYVSDTETNISILNDWVK